MKILDWLCAIAVVALGIVHCLLTPVIYRSFSLSALWFFAAGLALVFAGMLNVLRLKGPEAGTRPVTRASRMRRDLLWRGCELLMGRWFWRGRWSRRFWTRRCWNLPVQGKPLC